MLFWLVSGFGCNTASDHWKIIAVPPSGIQVWKTSMPIAHLITLYISASTFVMCQLFLLLQQRASAFIATSLSWVITFSWAFGCYFVPYDFFFPLQNDFLFVTFNHIFPFRLLFAPSTINVFCFVFFPHIRVILCSDFFFVHKYSLIWNFVKTLFWPVHLSSGFNCQSWHGILVVNLVSHVEKLYFKLLALICWKNASSAALFCEGDVFGIHSSFQYSI